MKKCCHCFSARRGAYIIAILGIILGITGLVASSIKIIENGLETIFYCIIVGSACYIIVQFLLLLGLLKNCKSLILSWLIFEALYGLLCVVLLGFVTYVVGSHICHKDEEENNILNNFFCESEGLNFKLEGLNVGVMLIISTVLSVGFYSWTVVRQVYEDLKNDGNLQMGRPGLLRNPSRMLVP